MKRFAFVALALIFSAPILSAQERVVDKDKTRNTDRGNVQWKTKRTSNVDVPYFIPQYENGAAVFVPGVQRAWTLQTAVTAGATIAAGAISVSIVPSSDFAGTINGATITGTTNGGAFNVRANPPDTLPAIIYTRTAGSLNISVLR
jgi:hypothetical protein